MREGWTPHGRDPEQAGLGSRQPGPALPDAPLPGQSISVDNSL